MITVSNDIPLKTRPHLRLIVWAAIFIFQWSITGCAWLGRTPVDDPLAREVVERLKLTNESLKQFKELAHIRLGVQQERRSFSMALASALPDRMRVELLSVVGQPITSMVADGQNIRIRSYGNERIYQLQQSPTALKRFIHIPLGVEHLQGILIGRPRLPEYTYAQIKEQSEENLVVVLKNRWRIVALLEFDLSDFKIKMMEVYDSEGDIRYRIQWTQWRRVGQYHLPSRLEVASNEGAAMSLTMKRFWPDTVLSDETFQLDQNSSKQ